MSAPDILAKLQEWYSSQCDGEWEHKYGVEITTCDNPGWWVKIDLVGTRLQEKPFEPIIEGLDSGATPTGIRWLHCSVKDGVWHGAGDETRLPAILDQFLRWVEMEGPAEKP